MARKRTGLRNKYRSGRSTYSLKGKGKNADRYGSYSGGKMSTPEIVAGVRIDKDLPRLNRD